MEKPPAESQQRMFSPHPSLAVNVTLANLKVQLLWFTDYLVLVADSESGLQDFISICVWIYVWEYARLSVCVSVFLRVCLRMCASCVVTPAT